MAGAAAGQPGARAVLIRAQASASRPTMQALPRRAEEAWALRKQSKCREKALFFVGRSLRVAGAPLPAPPLQQRNKTAAIFRFVSNSPSDPGVGSPVREAFVRALMSSSRRAADSPGSWPPSPPGSSEPRMLPRQREG